jgi:hypothetical protein
MLCLLLRALPLAVAELCLVRPSPIMTPLKVPAGSAVMLGAAAKPMPKTLSATLGQLVRGTAGIREAYLPQCFVRGIVEPPAQVLVVVLDAEADHPRVLDLLGQGLVGVLPAGMHLDVWPMRETDDLLRTVRGTRTHIHCDPPPERKPWWKFR